MNPASADLGRRASHVREFFATSLLARWGFAIALLLILAALLAPWLAPQPPSVQSLEQRLLPPAPQHLFGTDELGRDILARTLYGARISLLVGFSVVLGAGLTGLAVGMGALFPSLRETNPSKIVSGFGGTLTLILSITLVMLAVAAEAAVCHRYLVLDLARDPSSEVARTFQVTLLSVFAAIVCVAGLAAYLPLKLGARELERMEF